MTTPSPSSLSADKRRILEELVLRVKSGDITPPSSTRRSCEQWENDPVGYINGFLNLTLTVEQERVARNMLIYQRQLVKACQGVGKTLIAAALALWHFDCRMPSKCLTTAPTKHQVKDLLWGELRRLSGPREGLMPADTHLSGSNSAEHYIDGMTARTADSFQGTHAENLLIIFDEAVGIKHDFWVAADGMLVSEKNLWLAICNPTDVSSMAYQADTAHDSKWHVESISALTHPNVLEALIWREKYGTLESFIPPIPGAVSLPWMEDHLDDWCQPIHPSDALRTDIEWPPHSGAWYRPGPIFEGRVLGRWPSSSTDTIWSDALWDSMVLREAAPIPDEPPQIGCDLARFGCFDDQTEVLTTEGWKYFPAISGEEKILTLRDGIAEWGNIEKVYTYPFQGNLYHYETRSTDFCITENHKLYAKGPRQSTWSLKEYKDLPENFVLYATNSWKGTDPGEFSFTSHMEMPHGGVREKRWSFTQEDWFEFLGWFVSEGNVYKDIRQEYKGRSYTRLRILISQRPGVKKERIRALLLRMGILFQEKKTHQFEFSNNPIGEHLREFGSGAHNKHLLRYVLDAPPHLLTIFLESYCSGDGTYRDGRRLTYSTSSRALVDNIQEILAKLGRSGSVSLHSPAGSVTTIEGRSVTRHHDVYTINEKKDPTDTYVLKKNVTRMPYDGTVYCLQTPLHIFMVRRNGKVLWSGNSDSTVFHVRRGNVSLHHEWHQGWNSASVAGRLKQLANEYAYEAKMDGGERILISIDNTGDQAGGVMDARGQYRFRSVKSTSGARRPKEYPNKRSELWFMARNKAMKEGLDLTRLSPQAKERLHRQLLSPTWKPDPQGRYLVEPKDVTKSRLGGSPDDADGFNLAYADEGPLVESYTIIHTQNEEKFKETDWRRQLYSNNDSLW